ncbi:lactonase family protein [Ornithinibacillus gellani]|uniref:lactonase family protein n=1 Tax=Ornithinibacillus gellani TaxID=2293253 RepID=UPI000F471BC1|nr:lactonase family protein [Ornithinibacillus gellani]TQS74928.1 lactonase family protein [Ornithinibacillus gellani]
MENKYIGYAGTYTRQTSEGIYRFELNTETKKLQAVEVAAKIGSPTYLTIDTAGTYLYAVAQDGEQGGVAAFSITKDGTLEKTAQILEAGAPPCHVDVRADHLFAGNYHKGTAQSYAVDGQGGLEQEAVVAHAGQGPHERQEKPHVHFAGAVPDGRFIVVADLGTDELVTYAVEDQKLIKKQTYQAKPGSGPRHIVFHPDGKTAYLMTELSSDVIVLDYATETGSFTEKQVIHAIPDDFTETNDASAIRISSDGRFVYTGNRGHNSITVFQVDETTKELTWIEHTPTGGEWPRDFTLDPSERFLIASNQHTGNVVLFERDTETGKLTKLQSEIAVPEVVCVTFK